MYLINKIQESIMDDNKCIFKGRKASRCKSEKQKDLPLLMCQQHLKQYYGLEMGYVKIDGIKHVGFPGGFLKPIEGYSHFSRGEVIIPTRNFFDVTFRSEDLNVDIEQYRNYFMNSRIHEMVREYQNDFPDDIEHRQAIEMYRNFIEPSPVDPGPIQKNELPKLQALVESRKNHSGVFIRTQPVNQTLADNSVFIDNKGFPITSLNWSVNFQYLLNNCLYSEFAISDKSNEYLDLLPFNTVFLKNIGLVAVEEIVDPSFLVIDGHSKGSQIYYNAHVGLVQKPIQQNRYTLKDIPRQYTLSDAWKGGTIC